jgi:CheY-like chemotaxis protein
MQSQDDDSHGAAAASVLLVEDDSVFAAAAASVLRAAGFSVVHAPDHRVALEELESERPIALLLTDIVMPERVNGLALARMARLRRPELRILYMSGYDIPGLAGEALGSVLRKPIDNDTLVAAVREALSA